MKNKVREKKGWRHHDHEDEEAEEEKKKHQINIAFISNLDICAHI